MVSLKTGTQSDIHVWFLFCLHVNKTEYINPKSTGKTNHSTYERFLPVSFRVSGMGTKLCFVPTVSK